VTIIPNINRTDTNINRTNVRICEMFEREKRRSQLLSGIAVSWATEISQEHHPPTVLLMV